MNARQPPNLETSSAPSTPPPRRGNPSRWSRPRTRACRFPRAAESPRRNCRSGRGQRPYLHGDSAPAPARRAAVPASAVSSRAGRTADTRPWSAPRAPNWAPSAFSSPLSGRARQVRPDHASSMRSRARPALGSGLRRRGGGAHRRAGDGVRPRGDPGDQAVRARACDQGHASRAGRRRAFPRDRRRRRDRAD